MAWARLLLDVVIDGRLHRAGTFIEFTDELKSRLRPEQYNIFVLPSAVRLDQHLERATTEQPKKKRMNKFQEIAEGMARRRKEWDARADRLIAGMTKLDSDAENAFSAHEGKLAEAEAGFKDMQDAIRDLTGANGPPEG